MSRIGKKPIPIPAGVEVKIKDDVISVKGPKGELSREIWPEVKVEVKEKEIYVLPQKETSKGSRSGGTHGLGKKTKAIWGLTRALIFNIVQGVTNGFEKKLEMQGIGFNASVQNGELILNVGFSHPVKIKIPQGLDISVEKNIITISGIDKELIGQTASTIRKIKPPEPYKGKGIRYLGEIIKRKVGKKVTTTAG